MTRRDVAPRSRACSLVGCALRSSLLLRLLRPLATWRGEDVAEAQLILRDRHGRLRRGARTFLKEELLVYAEPEHGWSIAVALRNKQLAVLFDEIVDFFCYFHVLLAVFF